MAQALQDIQRILGPEALVVSARQVPGGPAWQVWKSKDVEVVAMSPAVTPRPLPERPAPAGGDSLMPALAHEVARVRTSLAELSSRIANGAVNDWPGPIAEVHHLLLEQGVDEALVRKAAAVCAEALGPWALENSKRVRSHLRGQMEAMVRALPVSAAAADRVICLIGASGVGKTATAAKLAWRLAAEGKRRGAWVCADTVRAGAVAEARMYAESFRLPFHAAYTPEDLAAAVDSEAEADLVLVDTPACNPQRASEVVDLGALLTALPNRATYLVVPATAKDSDVAQAISAFGPFNLRGLVVTKMDETATFGPAFNAAWRSRLPLIYFCSSRGALEGLEAAQGNRLVGALFGEKV